MSLRKKALDVYLAIWHSTGMPKHIVKVSGGKSSFRVVVPCKIIKKLGWQNESHLVIEASAGKYIVLRRLFDDETSKRSD